MKRLVLASMAVAIILSGCSSAGLGSAQSNRTLNQVQEKEVTVEASSSAVNDQEYFAYSNNGLWMKLPKDFQSISEDPDGTSFIYDTENDAEGIKLFLIAISGADIDKDHWDGSLQALNDYFISDAVLGNLKKMEKESVSPPKGLESISDITITKINCDYVSNDLEFKYYSYILSSFECRYTWVLSGIYSGKDLEDIPSKIDEIFDGLQYSKP